MERHRQLLLALLLLGLAAFCHPKQPLPPDANPAGATAALQDLYGIFSDEIKAGAVGNVYQAVGNRFQLEGKLYVAVLKALNAYDILQATTRLPEGDRVRLLPKSHQEARGGLCRAGRIAGLAPYSGRGGCAGL